MRRAVSCATCGRTTWAGCGHRVDQVMRSAPAAQRCPGHDEAARRPGGVFSRFRFSRFRRPGSRPVPPGATTGRGRCPVSGPDARAGVDLGRRLRLGCPQ